MTENSIAAQRNFGAPLRGYSNIGLQGLPGIESLNTFELVVSLFLALITVIAVLVFMFLLFTGAVGYITSGGDKGKTEDARRKITTGLVGLVIVIAAIFMVDLIAYVLDINILDAAGAIQSFSALIN